MKQVIEYITNEDLTSVIVHTEKGFRVLLRDDESGQTLPEAYTYSSYEKAIYMAKLNVGLIPPPAESYFVSVF